MLFECALSKGVLTMVFMVYDSGGALRCVSQVWPLARAALDVVVAQDDGLPRLEIYADSDFKAP